MVKKRRKKAKPKAGGRIIKLFILVLAVLLVITFIGYRKLYKPNVRLEQKDKQTFLYIHTGSTYEDVLKSLKSLNYLVDVKSFEWMAAKMNYTSNVKPGRYLLKNGMSNRKLLSMLRSGNQAPVDVVVPNARLKRRLAFEVSRYIEADSLEILKLLNNDIFLSKYGFNPKTALAMFIPNTYEFFWTTSPEQLFERIHKEYKKFWNETRLAKAESTGLSPMEVSILASIVEEETQKNDEKPTIAGLYINRLNKKMLLQADPTVRFACGNFAIKRILEKDKAIDSPYNTYRYIGLPPGVICIPSIASIDAVLNFDKNNYLYMCAKEDFSGYHNFARTLEQHLINAQRYQKALNKARIRR
jgi:UPF0755 protein